MGRAYITKEMAMDIKARLWNGEFHKDISIQYSLSMATISLICTGKMHYDIPWPDGTCGGLPQHRVAEIELLRRKTSMMQSTVKSLSSAIISGDMREEMLERLQEENEIAAEYVGWEECALVLGSTHMLIKRGNKNDKVRRALQQLIGSLPVPQRTVENIERNFDAVLAGMPE